MRANISRAVQKGVHAARAPYGLQRVYEGREVKWELDPLEATVVREMYRLAVDENLGFKSIADRLGDKGYLARGGQPFASYTIQRVLSNEALMGTLTYGKRPRKGNPKQEIVQAPGSFLQSSPRWSGRNYRSGYRLDVSYHGVARTPVFISSAVLSGVATAVAQ